jgi:hypothetical protein
MIINDDSSVISEQSFLLIDDARGIIYDRHMYTSHRCKPIEGSTEKVNKNGFVVE